MLRTLILHKNVLKFYNSMWYPLNLQNLDLSCNKIQEIHHIPLRNDLHSLDLTDNNINLTDCDWMKYLPRLFISNNLFSSKKCQMGNVQKLVMQSSSLKSLFPLHLQNIKILSLSKNNITELNTSDFFHINVSSLKKLDLSQNKLVKVDYLPKYLISLTLSENHIEKIETHVFQQLNFLTHLYLSRNRLKSLEVPVLWKLEVLDLSHNSLQEAGSFANLPSLKHVYLNNNHLKIMPDFSSSVTYVNLAENDITSISSNIDLPNLRQLVLGKNHISRLWSSSFTKMKQLEYLFLQENKIKGLPDGAFSSLRHLRELWLVGNFLQLDFQVDYFQGLSLERLDLRENNITNIVNLFMYNSVQKVKNIALAKNPLRKITKFNLTLSERHISTRTIDLLSCGLQEISPDSFESLPNLNYVNLAENNLTYLPQFVAHPDAKRYLVLDAHENPLECSCRIRWLKEEPLTATAYKFYYCKHVVYQKLVSFDHTPLDEFVCPTAISCDTRVCNCYTHDIRNPPDIVHCRNQSLTHPPKLLSPTAIVIDLKNNNFSYLAMEDVHQKMSATVLYLQFCNIQTIQVGTFDNFINLKELYLDNNYIHMLSGSTFRRNYRLNVLSVSHNTLVTIASGLFSNLNSLEYLYLSSNNLTSIGNVDQNHISSLLYLKNIGLGSNPWHCPCEQNSLYNWINSLSTAVGDASDILCSGKSIAVVARDCHIEEVLSRDKLTRFLTIGLSILFLASFCLLALIYSLRLQICVLLFHCCGLKLGRKHIKEGMLYDAMLVYDTDSETALPWIQSSLLNNSLLSKENYKFYISERDMLPGTVMTEELYETVYKSASIVFILTKGFDNNGLFLYTIRNAFERMRKTYKFNVIFVMLDPILKKDIKHLETDKRLKALLSARKFLSPSDRLFWQRLHYEIPNVVRRQSSEQTRLPADVSSNNSHFVSA